MLSSRQNLTALMDLPGTWIDLVQGCAPLDKLILDMDSPQSQTYGHQEGSAHKCYFECPDVRRDCHPLFMFNQRGTAEQWIKEGKYAVKWTRLSCRDFKDNQVRLQLLALTYNLGNFLRRLALPKAVKHWSLIPARRDCGRSWSRSGPKWSGHAKYVTFQPAEVAIPRELFATILGRIQRFGVPRPRVRRG
jgi:hypothetical protein